MRLLAEPAPIPLGEIDLSDPRRFRDGDQHGAWRTLRDEAPVWRHRAPSGADVWSATRYETCRRVLKDHESFTVERGSILDVVGIGDRAGGISMALTDPPRHGVFRAPAMRVFAPTAVRAHAARARERVRRLVAPWLAGGEHDVAEVALELPMAASGELIGLARSDWSSAAFWSMAAIAPEDPVFAAGSRGATLARAHHELFECVSSAIRARRKQPRRDLVSALVALEVDGRRLADAEIALTLYNVVLGANNTTPQAVSHLLLALAARPELWRRLVADRALIPAAVEEGLRFASPANHYVRHAVRDVELDGTVVPAGEAVCAWIASADRDERVFDEPYRFALDRASNPHLAFGVGAHYCLGAPSVRALLTQLLEELTASVERLEAVGEPTHLLSTFVNGVTHARIEFTPVRARRPASAVPAHA